MTATLAVHAWNEAQALERLLLSSLHACHLFDEWVVLDHRSTDDTQTILDELEGVLAAHSVTLTRLRESRDLSRKLTFADVRARTVHAARNHIVALMDADFILGDQFASTLEAAMTTLTRRNATASAVAFPTPVIWDHLTTNEDGVIVRHGRVWRHGSKARIMHRDRVTYRQTGNKGKWEKLIYLDSGRARTSHVPNDGSVLISANIKPAKRIELRRTMTMFAAEAKRGRHGTRGWLQAAEAGKVAKMPKYEFVDLNLTGVRLNLANLSVST